MNENDRQIQTFQLSFKQGLSCYQTVITWSVKIRLGIVRVKLGVEKAG